MIAMETIFNLGRPLTSSDVRDSYTKIAVDWNLSNYRIYSIQGLVSNKIRRGEDIPDYLYDFIGEQGEVLGMANVIGGHVFTIKFKSLKEKKFLTVGTKRALPYGIGTLSGFKYGSWLVLVEGEKDRDSLAQVYPYVICTSTAGAGSVMREIILSLTNRLVILYDSDESGLKAFYRDRKFFQERHCQVVKGEHPPNCKDPGTLADLLYKGDMFNFDLQAILPLTQCLAP